VERQKKAGAKRGEEKRKGWWLKRESPIRKVHRDQRGLGPRLRVARHAVGAKAQFQAQRTILHYRMICLRLGNAKENIFDHNPNINEQHVWNKLQSHIVVNVEGQCKMSSCTQMFKLF